MARDGIRWGAMGSAIIACVFTLLVSVLSFDMLALFRLGALFYSWGLVLYLCLYQVIITVWSSNLTFCLIVVFVFNNCTFVEALPWSPS